MRRLMLVPGALLLAAAAGCTWSDLDAEFLAGVPDLGSLKVRPPTQMGRQQQALTSGAEGLGSQQSALQSETAKGLEAGANDLNALIDGLAAGLDFIRQIPPSKRETDSRTWGPYPDDDQPGFEIQVVMARNVDGYEYSVSWSPSGQDRFATVVEGTFKGERASEGEGSFTIHSDRACALSLKNQNCDLVQTTLRYEHGKTATEDVQVWVSATNAAGDTAVYRHLRDTDGGGTMSYSVKVQQDWGVIGLRAEAAWLGDRSGHFWESLSGIVGGPYENEECWDADLDRFYVAAELEDGTVCKSLPSCLVGDAAAAERCVPIPSLPSGS